MPEYRIDLDSFDEVDATIVAAAARGEIVARKPRSSDLFREDAARYGFWAISPYYAGEIVCLKETKNRAVIVCVAGEPDLEIGHIRPAASTRPAGTKNKKGEKQW